MRSLDCAVTGLCGHWTVRSLDCVVTGLCGHWTVRSLDGEVTGLCGHWTVRSLDCAVTHTAPSHRRSNVWRSPQFCGHFHNPWVQLPSWHPRPPLQGQCWTVQNGKMTLKPPNPNPTLDPPSQFEQQATHTYSDRK